MARTTNFDFGGAVVLVESKPFSEVTRCYIHQRLLEEHSSVLRRKSKDAQGKCSCTPPQQAGGKVHSCHITRLTVDLGPEGLKRWCSWLYGGPMWRPLETSDNTETELATLADVHSSCSGDDIKAADTCSDHIKQILVGWLDEPPMVAIGRLENVAGNPSIFSMFVELLVHLEIPGKHDMALWLDLWKQGYGCIRGDEVFGKMSGELALKIDLVNKKEEPVDVMERCRYHEHVEKGEPCYLDG